MRWPVQSWLDCFYFICLKPVNLLGTHVQIRKWDGFFRHVMIWLQDSIWHYFYLCTKCWKLNVIADFCFAVKGRCAATKVEVSVATEILNALNGYREMQMPMQLCSHPECKKQNRCRRSVLRYFCCVHSHVLVHWMQTALECLLNHVSSSVPTCEGLVGFIILV